MHQFETQLIKSSGKGGRVFIVLPPDTCESLRKKGRIPVCGSFNGLDFRLTLMPGGDGSYYLFVSKAVLKVLNKTAGDFIRVEIDHDAAPRIHEIPEDLTEALEVSPDAKRTFSSFTWSHQREVLNWIQEAVKPETRARRIVKAIQILERTQTPENRA